MTNGTVPPGRPDPDDKLAAFRAELGQRRKAAGLTYTQAAAAAGMSPARWRAIECPGADDACSQPRAMTAADATWTVYWTRADDDSLPELVIEIAHDTMSDANTVIYLVPTELRDLIAGLATIATEQPD